MKQLLTALAFMLAFATASFSQVAFYNSTDTLTNTDSETFVIFQDANTRMNSFGTFYIEEDDQSGSAAATIAFEATLDNSTWFAYPHFTVNGASTTSTTSIGAEGTGTTIVFTPVQITFDSSGVAKAYGCPPVRGLRAVVSQTGTGVSVYHIEGWHK